MRETQQTLFPSAHPSPCGGCCKRTAACWAAYMREWTARNVIRVNAERRARYQERRGEIRPLANERNRRYSRTEKGRLRALAAGHARRALLREDVAPDPYWLAVLRKDPCSYCGGFGGEIDHIVPLKRGGTNADDNLAAACRSCNARKAARPLWRYLLSA